MDGWSLLVYKALFLLVGVLFIIVTSITCDAPSLQVCAQQDEVEIKCSYFVVFSTSPTN